MAANKVGDNLKQVGDNHIIIAYIHNSRGFVSRFDFQALSGIPRTSDGCGCRMSHTIRIAARIIATPRT